jgi:tRNA (cytidine/uridine-2'-O-)-methyltransferase
MAAFVCLLLSTSFVQDFSYKPGDWLVFGSETKGLPDSALEDCSGEALGGGTIRIPMVETYVRCLNLSVSVGVALYEAARQLNYEQLHYQPDLPEEAQGLFPAEDIYG